MEKINILSTKFMIESEIKRLHEVGIFFSFHPFITVESKNDNKTIEKTKQVFENTDNQTLFVFTSVNALRFLYLAQKYVTKNLKTAKVACIDGITLQNSYNFFDAKNVVIKAPNAAQLAEQITKSNFKKVIHFCGNISLGEVSDALTLTGKKAERFVVYETKLTPAKVKQKCHGILFFSPSAAESFYMENEPDADVVSFAIGATTAKEIIKHHNNEIIVCEKPSQHEMISKVIERFKKEQV
ncbi:MAG TPA: uroporphyrinogen-III synthase [Bacteroidia bacterium]|nr:uroporphyrinogen-III synthase [Bacteroidia bacterium]HNU33261.1 uroporphyrinogen-III synthase [Bacteroidia bacterium]